jgi:hypothetical protein
MSSILPSSVASRRNEGTNDYSLSEIVGTLAARGVCDAQRCAPPQLIGEHFARMKSKMLTNELQRFVGRLAALPVPLPINQCLS